jgi:two-component system nitrogen regulation response regulator GlnG
MDIKTKVLELEKELFIEKEGALYRSILQIVEKPLIENILERTDGNQLKAARILGLNRNTLRTKIKRLGINLEKWKNT